MAQLFIPEEYFSLQAYNYELPEELIAKYPPEERDDKNVEQETQTNAYVLEGDVRGVRFDDLSEFAEAHENIVIEIGRAHV